MTEVAKLDDNTLRAICDILGDTETGFSGTEIGRLLHQAGIEDVSIGTTKRYRLFDALKSKQDKDGCANNVFHFIKKAMDPIRFASNKSSIELFGNLRNSLNVVLAMRGFQLREDGEIIFSDKVNTICEAQMKAGRLEKLLRDRNVHNDVLKFCRAELMQENYFHAVFEATKSIADKIRAKSSLTSDGSELIDEAFNIIHPLLAINTLTLETEKSEQKGFMNLLKGIFGMFRNVTAHAPKIKWKIDEGDALDLLTLVSFAHKKLDATVETGLRITND